MAIGDGRLQEIARSLYGVNAPAVCTVDDIGQRFLRAFADAVLEEGRKAERSPVADERQAFVCFDLCRYCGGLFADGYLGGHVTISHGVVSPPYPLAPRVIHFRLIREE